MSTQKYKVILFVTVDLNGEDPDEISSRLNDHFSRSLDEGVPIEETEATISGHAMMIQNVDED